MQEKDEKEKVLDIKGTIESFIEEERPELSQEEAIKKYNGENQESIRKKKKSNSSEDDEYEDDEHLKRVKKELLESLERVNILEKNIFGEKENLKNKVKLDKEKTKDREKVIEQMKQKVQEEKQNNENNERSRE